MKQYKCKKVKGYLPEANVPQTLKTVKKSIKLPLGKKKK